MARCCSGGGRGDDGGGRTWSAPALAWEERGEDGSCESEREREVYCVFVNEIYG